MRDGRNQDLYWASGHSEKQYPADGSRGVVSMSVSRREIFACWYLERTGRLSSEQDMEATKE